VGTSFARLDYTGGAQDQTVLVPGDPGTSLMAHSESLRVIGQLLEAGQIHSFELEADGPNYFVKGDSLTHVGEWVLRNALGQFAVSEDAGRQTTASPSVRFSLTEIYRLDRQAQLRRRREFTLPDSYNRLSQLLRTLGDHLDRMNVGAFQICWMSDSISVFFQLLDGQCDSLTFTVEKLQRLGLSSRFRRSSRAGT